MIKIGILGTGFGQVHAQIFKKIPNIEIIGIFGRNKQKLQKIQEELQISTFTNAEELIHNPDIDLIDVVLPTNVHKEFVIKALKAGKHVFCETPLAYSLEDAQKMLKTAEETGKELFVGMFMLFSPEFRYPLEKITNSTFGEIRRVFMSRRTPRIWKNMDPIELNLMIHDFDYIFALLGNPTTISSQKVISPLSKGEVVSTYLEYKNTLAHIEGSSMHPESYRFSLTMRVDGDHETIEVLYPMNNNFDNCQVIHYPKEGKKYEPKIDYKDEYICELQYVIDYLEGKVKNRINQIEIAINSFKLALLAKNSNENDGIRISLE